MLLVAPAVAEPRAACAPLTLPALLPVTGGEAQDLIKTGGAPARFADYRPAFRLRSGEWETSAGGRFGQTRRGRRFDIYDGERLVAYFESSWAKGVGRGQIHVVEMNPLQPWNPGGFKRVHRPLPNGQTPRWCRITLTPWFGNTREAEQTYDVSTDGTRVTITNRLQHAQPEARSLSACVMRVDPYCGYVLDLYWEFAAPEPDFDSILDAKKRKKMKWRFERSGVAYEFCNIMPNFLGFHLTKPRMDWRYEWLLWSQVGHELLMGAYDDFPLSNQFKFVCPIRSGGLVGFAADPQGWGQFLSRFGGEGVKFDNDTCNVLLDQHNKLSIPEPGKDGLYRASVRGRYMNLPPEAVDAALRSFRQNKQDLLLRVPVDGTLSFDTDDTQGVFGRAWHGLGVTGDQARSPKRCARLPYNRRQAGRTRAVFLQPVPPLDAAKRYRLEAWVLAHGETTRARLHLRPSTWKPRNWDGPELEKKTSEATVGSNAWQRLSLEIEMPESHGRSPRLGMWVKIPEPDGALYIDDVSISTLPTGR
jgi:hypothetical protein